MRTAWGSPNQDEPCEGTGSVWAIDTWRGRLVARCMKGLATRQAGTWRLTVPLSRPQTWATDGQELLLCQGDGLAKLEDDGTTLVAAYPIPATALHCSGQGWLAAGKGGAFWARTGIAPWTEYARIHSDASIMELALGGSVAYALDGKSQLWRNDGGDWVQEPKPPGTPMLFCLHATADRAWAAGDDGCILMRGLNGWQRLALDTTGGFSNFAFAAGYLWACGSAGAWYSADGLTFQQVPIEGPRGNIYCAHEGDGAVFLGGDIF